MKYDIGYCAVVLNQFLNVCCIAATLNRKMRPILTWSDRLGSMQRAHPSLHLLVAGLALAFADVHPSGARAHPAGSRLENQGAPRFSNAEPPPSPLNQERGRSEAFLQDRASAMLEVRDLLGDMLTDVKGARKPPPRQGPGHPHRRPPPTRRRA